MIFKYITTEVDIDVDVGLEDFDTDELIAEIESRTDRFMIDNDDMYAMSQAAKDNIYNLYRDYLNGKDFERKLKNFFEDHLGILVH